MLAAIRRASSLLSSLAAERDPAPKRNEESVLAFTGSPLCPEEQCRMINAPYHGAEYEI